MNRKMKFAVAVSALLIFLFLLNGIAFPATYLGADLVLYGSDFSAVSGFHDPPNDGWNVDGTAIWTNTQDHWVEYEVGLTQGRWQVGLETINQGNLGEDPWWYPQFELSVSLSSETLVVQASDTEVHHGFVEFDIPADGLYTARFTWLNDQAEGPLSEGGFELDANIRIERVFFDAIPDLASGQWIENPTNGHVYALTDEGLSFADAEAQAVSWGGHLVTVNDQAEQDWLYEQFGSWYYLIGLNDLDEEGTFVWVSGEQVTYTNWCRGEPNDYLGEDVVSMVGGAQCWNDIPGGNTSIVEVDSASAAWIEASLSNDWVFGNGFVPNGLVDVDVNGSLSSVGIDPNGRFFFNP